MRSSSCFFHSSLSRPRWFARVVFRAAWLLVCAEPALAVGGEVPGRLDLGSAIAMAEGRSPAIVQAKAQREVSVRQHLNAKVAILPTLDLTSEHGFRDSPLVSEATTTVGSVGLLLSETLYDNGRQWIRRDRTRAEQERAELALARARERVALDLADAYFDFTLTQLSLEAERSQTKHLEEQEQRTSRLFQQGLTRQTSVQLIQAQLRRARLRVLRSEQTLIEARLRILELIGIDATGPSAGASPSTASSSTAQPTNDRTAIEPLPLESLAKEPAPREEAGRETWSARERLLLERIAGADVELARADFGLQIDINASGQYVAQGYLGGASETQSGFGASALLVLKANLWDWSTRKRAIEIAASQKTLALSQLRERELAESAELKGGFEKLKLLAESVSTSRELLQLQERASARVQSEYAVGRASYLELTTALSDLTNARITVSSEIVSLLKVIFRIRYQYGELYESLSKK